MRGFRNRERRKSRQKKFPVGRNEHEQYSSGQTSQPSPRANGGHTSLRWTPTRIERRVHATQRFPGDTTWTGPASISVVHRSWHGGRTTIWQFADAPSDTFSQKMRATQTPRVLDTRKAEAYRVHVIESAFSLHVTGTMFAIVAPVVNKIRSPGFMPLLDVLPWIDFREIFAICRSVVFPAVPRSAGRAYDQKGAFPLPSTLTVYSLQSRIYTSRNTDTEVFYPHRRARTRGRTTERALSCTREFSAPPIRAFLPGRAILVRPRTSAQTRPRTS